MLTTIWRSCAVALVGASAAYAAPTEPADPNSSVPAMQYESAFKDYRPAVDPTVSPDKAWRTANDAVAATSGHDGMMNMPMGGSMGMAMPKPGNDSKTSDQEQKTPIDKDMTMPMPKGQDAMPGMDMSHDQRGKGQ
jgi:hypothetical protein